MTPPLRSPTPVLTTAICCAVCATVAGQEAPKKNYSLRAGDAAATLKLFASHSGEQGVYMADNVRGETTSAVRSQFVAREALERMLAGTRLFATQDRKPVRSWSAGNVPSSPIRPPRPNAPLPLPPNNPTIA
jgi:hypothetical protein